MAFSEDELGALSDVFYRHFRSAYDKVLRDFVVTEAQQAVGHLDAERSGRREDFDHLAGDPIDHDGIIHES